MDNKQLLIASLIGGLVSTVLSNTPVLNLINCVLCAGFWAGPFLAVWIYRRQTSAVTLPQGIGIGTLAGLWAGLFGLLLSFGDAAGIEALMETYQQYLPPEAMSEVNALGPLEFVMNIFGVGFNIMFGALGGLIGGAIFQTKATMPPPPPEY